MKTTTSSKRKIPLFDLSHQYAPLRKELIAAATRVLDSGVYILGPEVSAFESEFARAMQVPHCAGVSSGTQALLMALDAAGVRPGDEVLVPAVTFAATATAVSCLGARPVFVDVDPITLTLDPLDAAAKVTPRTKAVIPVHLYGYPADMDPILALAKDRGLRVIEDCAQAHLTEHKGKLVGGLGDLGCFSFYPSKNLGAVGDAGAVVTRDASLHQTVVMLRNVGQEPGQRYTFKRVSQNFRLDEMQAALLRVKLPHLEARTQERRAIAAKYRAALEGLPLQLPPEDKDGNKHSYHLFILQTPQRDALARRLAEASIDTGVYYPIPLHLQPAYAGHGHREGDLPQAERACRQVLALPMYPGLSDADIERISDEIRGFHDRKHPVPSDSLIQRSKTFNPNSGGKGSPPTGNRDSH